MGDFSQRFGGALCDIEKQRRSTNESPNMLPRTKRCSTISKKLKQMNKKSMTLFVSSCPVFWGYA